MKNALILLGAPGSGKGTQSNLIADKFNLLTYCMGDIVRSEMSSETDLGKEMKGYITKGDLVPDEVIISMFNDNFNKNDNSNGFISDGFPRTVKQAEFLDNLLKDKGINSLILLMDVEKEKLVERLLARKRFDDTKEVIENRINTYNSEVSLILNYYGTRVMNINCDGQVDSIFLNILNIINNA